MVPVALAIRFRILYDYHYVLRTQFGQWSVGCGIQLSKYLSNTFSVACGAVYI